ncbi:MAG: HAD family phosphatase [Firmicutes bacterium]|nr:HAD family phosphatase [Bacillota bacterium]
MLTNYRLLVLDLDGTVLDQNSRLTARTEAALNKAQTLGLKITFATGRLFSDALPYAKRLGLTLPLILNHGAILQTMSGKILARHQIESYSAQALIAIADQTGTACQLYKAGQLYLQHLAPWNQEYLRYSTVTPHIVPDLAAIAAQEPEQIDFLGEPKELNQIKALIESNLGSRVTITSSYRHLLEVLAAGVSKGAALQHLAAQLNIPLEATIAVGDGYNDIGLIRTAGLGVAMGNAPEAVRRQADYITAPNSKDGLALFLDRLFPAAGT